MNCRKQVHSNCEVSFYDLGPDKLPELSPQSQNLHLKNPGDHREDLHTRSKDLHIEKKTWRYSSYSQFLVNSAVLGALSKYEFQNSDPHFGSCKTAKVLNTASEAPSLTLEVIDGCSGTSLLLARPDGSSEQTLMKHCRCGHLDGRRARCWGLENVVNQRPAREAGKQL